MENAKKALENENSDLKTINEISDNKQEEVV